MVNRAVEHRRASRVGTKEQVELAVFVSSLAGINSSTNKCDLIPRWVQRYLGIMCDNERVAYRVPQDEL